MLRMTHVEPENIGPFVDQLPQRFRFLARRAQRANDFRSAHSSSNHDQSKREMSFNSPIDFKAAINQKPACPECPLPI
jgi:hypothetical protein